MVAELGSEGEFSELVTDHLFCHVDWWELFSVVDSECESNELWRDVAVASPSLHDLLLLLLDHLHDLPKELRVDVGAFLEGACHGREIEMRSVPRGKLQGCSGQDECDSDERDDDLVHVRDGEKEF